MIRGLYTAAAGMITQQNRQDILTNNLANMNTPGFKQDQGVIRAFPEVLLQMIRTSEQPNPKIGSLHQGVFLEESISKFSQGDLLETGVATHMAIWDQDLAIDGNTGKRPNLFFTVEDQEGNRFYTRSGLFNQDGEGNLVTPEGYLVLDDWNYPIQSTSNSFTMNEKGQIVFDNGDEIQVGLTVIPDPNQLVKQGNSLFRYIGDEADLAFVEVEENYTILQGSIERANVDPSQTMVDMMTAMRLYEANQKAIQSIDRTLEKAVNEIGRV